MTGKILASCLLFVGGVFSQDQPIKKHAALEAQIINIAKSKAGSDGRTTLGLTIKITNTGPNYVYALLFGEPSAIDDAGGHWANVTSVTGMAYCPGPQSNPPTFRLCIGLPRVVDQLLFPLQGYTEIPPGEFATVNFLFRNGTDKGTKFYVTQEIAFRLLKQEGDDADWSEDKKLKSLHLGSLTFNEATPKEQVQSSISYAPMK